MPPLPVNRLVIAFGRYHLRGQIVRGSAQGPSDIGHLLGKAEICDLQMTMAIQEKILRFQVAIDDMLGMKILEGQSHLSGIELSDRIRESLINRQH